MEKNVDRIVWKKEFSVGIPEIDDQHKQLVGMINDLAETHDAEHIFDAVMRMYKYADEHFYAEEEMMRRNNYPLIDKHIAAHNAFKRKTSDLAALDYTHPENELTAFVFLCDWLINHILTMDMQYKEYCI